MSIDDDTTGPRPITTVFFDLGDTLWHLPKMPPRGVIRGETMRRVEEVIRRWGYDMSGDRPFIGRDIRFAVEEETHRAFHGDCVDPGYPELCRRVAREHAMEVTPEQGAELWEAWNLGGLFLGRELFPDVIPTLSELRDRGFRLASVTNRGYSGPDFWAEVNHFGLDQLFEVIVVSCDVGYLKPHPRIYQVALERLDVEAEECLMVGDNLRADVEGPKTLGMGAVWRRPPLGEPVEETSDEVEVEGPVQPDFAIAEIGELLGLPPLQRA
ncbi:MAG: HAD family hydrolase [Dehalococcoidia bacterium]